MTPTPVVQLNLAVAVAMSDGPAFGLAMMDGIAATGELEAYPYLHAARGDLLRRLERWSEAEAAYTASPRPDDERLGAGVPGGSAGRVRGHPAGTDAGAPRATGGNVA